MKALVFAAGLGTRLKPLTDRLPKALVEVGGKPLLQHVLDKLQGAGFDDIVVNVHHFSEQVVAYLSSRPAYASVKISDESTCLLDTGGGLRKALSLFEKNESPVLIHNVDILSNVDVADFYARNKENAVTLLVSKRKTSRYLLVKNGRLVAWTNINTGEVKTPFADLDISECEYFAFSGIHLFSPALLPLMNAFPEKFPIMDFYLSLCDKVEIRCVEKENLRLLDVGKLDSLAEAEAFL